MVTPQEIYDFAFTREYAERYTYIESLNERNTCLNRKSS